MSKFDKDFVIVRMTGVTDAGVNNYKRGQVKIWPTYEGDVWGSAAYEVLEFVTGYIEASAKAREYRNAKA